MGHHPASPEGRAPGPAPGTCRISMALSRVWDACRRRDGRARSGTSDATPGPDRRSTPRVFNRWRGRPQLWMIALSVDRTSRMLWSVTKSVHGFALLERFKPILRYDSFEPYIATSVDALLCIGDADGSSGCCELARAGETLPFASVGRTPAPADVLAVTSAGSYADGRSWGAADQLRVSGRAEGMPDYRYEGSLQQERYGSTIYGRVAVRPDGWWLQYWLFYFYNDRIDPNAGPLVHEGDWEMVQIRLPPDNADPTRPAPRPDAVTFSQHVTGARRSGWQTRRQDDRLLVYPGRGTHACYPRRTRWGSWALDIRDGGYEVADASLVLLEDESALVQWSGFWGGNRTAHRSGGTHRLAARTAWRRPELYHEEADGLVRGVVRAAQRRPGARWSRLAAACAKHGASRRSSETPRRPRPRRRSPRRVRYAPFAPLASSRACPGRARVAAGASKSTGIQHARTTPSSPSPSTTSAGHWRSRI